VNKLAGSLDANVVLRLLLNDIPEQRILAKNLLKSSNNQFSVADAAFVEIVFVLGMAYSLTKEQVKEAVDGVMSWPNISCNRRMISAAIKLFVEKSGISFEDCVLVARAELNDALPLYTFDVRLAKSTDLAALLG
jgi:predicted nucleic-acid-binding protein